MSKLISGADFNWLANRNREVIEQLRKRLSRDTSLGYKCIRDSFFVAAEAVEENQNKIQD